MRPYGTPEEPTFLAMNDGWFRYLLTRSLGKGKRTICWVMLNPSTADESHDDPTMRRVIGFSQAGFDRVLVVNLYAKRCTDPSGLADQTEKGVVGPANDIAIAYAARAADEVVVAWGASPFAEGRWRSVYETIRCHYRRGIKCLGYTANGHPRHPLYVPRSTPFIEFAPPIRSPE